MTTLSLSCKNADINKNGVHLLNTIFYDMEAIVFLVKIYVLF